jgi:hypothetical protein
MDCGQAMEFYDLWRDHELEENQEKALIAHLESCELCDLEYDQRDKALSLLRQTVDQISGPSEIFKDRLSNMFFSQRKKKMFPQLMAYAALLLLGFFIRSAFVFPDALSGKSADSLAVLEENNEKLLQQKKKLMYKLKSQEILLDRLSTSREAVFNDREGNIPKTAGQNYVLADLAGRIKLMAGKKGSWALIIQGDSLDQSENLNYLKARFPQQRELFEPYLEKKLRTAQHN